MSFFDFLPGVAGIVLGLGAQVFVWWKKRDLAATALLRDQEEEHVAAVASVTTPHRPTKSRKRTVAVAKMQKAQFRHYAVAVRPERQPHA